MFKTVGDLLEFLYQQKGKRKEMITVEAAAPVHEAASLMKNNGINLLAVTSRGKYVAVVSSSDTSGELVSSLRPSERMVSDIMSRKVVTVRIDDNLMNVPKEVTDLHKFRHLIVVDGKGSWVAVLSSNEILQGVMKNIEEEEHFQAVLKAEDRRRD